MAPAALPGIFDLAEAGADDALHALQDRLVLKLPENGIDTSAERPAPGNERWNTPSPGGPPRQRQPSGLRVAVLSALLEVALTGSRVGR